MTLPLRLNKTWKYWKYLPFFLFLVWVFRNFGEIFILVTSLIMAVVLGGVYLQQKLKANGFAIAVYGFLAIGVVNFIIGIALYEFVFPLFLPFFPLLLIHYLITVRKNIPGTGAFLLMVIGFLVSVVYQTIIGRGSYEYFFAGDQTLMLGFLVFFSIYMLLALGIVSLWRLVIVLAFSVFPEIVYILFLYVKTGHVGVLLSQRFGGPVGVTANQVACWLDVAFPLALFIALFDKKRWIKWVFSIIALFYGGAILLSASRGSMVGLPLIPFFLASRAKSWMLRILVVVVSLAGFGLFGRGAVERTIRPNRADKIGTFGRTELLGAGLRMLKHNYYFFGSGMDNYRLEKYRYGFATAFDKIGGMSTHNAFLEIWLGWGFIAVVGWLIFVGGIIVRALRTPLPSEVNYLKPALLLALLITQTHWLFDSTVAIFPFLVFLFSLLACLSFLGTREKSRGSEKYGFPSDSINPHYTAH